MGASKSRNGVDRGPPRTTWPPPWLAPVGAVPGINPDNLLPEWSEHYLERVAIMVENGPVTSAVEAVALADTLDAMRRAGECP